MKLFLALLYMGGIVALSLWQAAKVQEFKKKWDPQSRFTEWRGVNTDFAVDWDSPLITERFRREYAQFKRDNMRRVYAVLALVGLFVLWISIFN